MATRTRPAYAPDYVWCDYHGEIHGTAENFYLEEEGEEACDQSNWRRVYIASTDPKEFQSE